MQFENITEAQNLAQIINHLPLDTEPQQRLIRHMAAGGLYVSRGVPINYPEGVMLLGETPSHPCSFNASGALMREAGGDPMNTGSLWVFMYVHGSTPRILNVCADRPVAADLSTIVMVDRGSPEFKEIKHYAAGSELFSRYTRPVREDAMRSFERVKIYRANGTDKQIADAIVEHLDPGCRRLTT